ncbi:MAG: 50S ribosomal protein L20 [Patescibacteria group bacterium]
MPRVKRGTTAHRKREKLLRLTKGFRWGRKSKERAAKEALLHAQARMFRGRKEKKRVFRALWNVRVNAAVREEGLSYSKLIAALKAKKIKLDRKVLADLAKNEPAVFKKVVAAATLKEAPLPGKPASPKREPAAKSK